MLCDGDKTILNVETRSMSYFPYAKASSKLTLNVLNRGSIVFLFTVNFEQVSFQLENTNS